MSRDHTDPKIAQVLERYCDGELSPEHVGAFEQLLDKNAALRGQVELQRRVDAALCGLFGEERLTDALPLPRPPAFRLGRVIAVAAVLLIAILLGVAYLQFGDSGRSPASYPQLTMQAYYDEAIAASFEPGWVCENDEQFAGAFDDRFDQPMLAGALPDGVELLGLGYGRVLSSRTVTVYARVHGRPVLLFVDRAARPLPTEPLSDGLYRYHRELGGVAIYEVSPLSRPHLLEHFYLVERNADERQ